MEELLTVEEVAAALKFSSATVRRMFARGDIPARKVGARQWRVSAAALEAYINGHVTEAASAPKARAKKSKGKGRL